jgi:isochorismate pyruvate lyase
MTDRDGLADLRAEIDRIDEAIVSLLAQRMGVVETVIGVKVRKGLPARIPDRVEEVVAHVRAAAADKGAPPDLAETVWRAIIEWTIAHEEQALKPSHQNPIAEDESQTERRT